MLRNTALGHASGKGRFGNRGEVNMDYVFGGALGLVIVAAIVLTVWQFMKAPGVQITMPDEFFFQCLDESCGKEFSKDKDKLARAEMMSSEEFGVMMSTCPDCGGQALQMDVCPKCGEPFMPECYLDDLMIDPEPGTWVCPHCNTDVYELRQEEMKKRAAEKKKK